MDWQFVQLDWTPLVSAAARIRSCLPARVGAHFHQLHRSVLLTGDRQWPCRCCLLRQLAPKARAGCLACLTLVGLGIASAFAYKFCCKYFPLRADCLDSGDDAEVPGDGDADDGSEDGALRNTSTEGLTNSNGTLTEILKAESRLVAMGNTQDRRATSRGDELEMTSIRSQAASSDQWPLLRKSDASLAQHPAGRPGKSSDSLQVAFSDESLTERLALVEEIDATREPPPQLRAATGESKCSGEEQQRRTLRFVCQHRDSTQTPSDPLSLSDDCSDDAEDADEAALADELHRRKQELQAPWQKPEMPEQLNADRDDCSSCSSSQLGSLHRGLSLFSEYAPSSAATTTSVVMDDSGVDFLCEAGDSRAVDHTLTKLDKLMETLEQVRLEAGGMCQSCDSLQAFANNLHSDVSEFDKSLLQAQLLCEEVSASERAPVSGISQSSSFGVDCDLASSSWSAYDEALQDRIAEIFAQAGLDELLAEEDEQEAQPIEAVNVGPLVSITEYADSVWGGATRNDERVRRGYSRLLADSSASFVRRVRDDQYCALRATLFSFFLHVTEFPQACEHWLETLSRNFAAHPWLSEWSGAHRLSEQAPHAAAGPAAPAPAEAQLQWCVRWLYSQLASVRAPPGSLYREWEVLQIFNGRLGDLPLMEAAKAMLLLRAAELHSACECGSAPVHAHLLFARDSSATLRDLFCNHIDPIGSSGRLGQAELLLLSDLLQAGIRLYRPVVYGDGEDFVLLLGCQPDRPQLQLVSECDTRYSVLLP